MSPFLFLFLFGEARVEVEKPMLLLFVPYSGMVPSRQPCQLIQAESLPNILEGDILKERKEILIT
jgi:hypothetical protein